MHMIHLTAYTVTHKTKDWELWLICLAYLKPWIQFPIHRRWVYDYCTKGNWAYEVNTLPLSYTLSPGRGNIPVTNWPFNSISHICSGGFWGVVLVIVCLLFVATMCNSFFQSCIALRVHPFSLLVCSFISCFPRMYCQILLGVKPRTTSKTCSLRKCNLAKYFCLFWFSVYQYSSQQAFWPQHF